MRCHKRPAQRILGDCRDRPRHSLARKPAHETMIIYDTQIGWRLSLSLLKSAFSLQGSSSCRLYNYNKRYNIAPPSSRSAFTATKSAKMKMLAAAAFLTLAFAAPVTETETQSITARSGSFSCPGGLTNSSPMCCSTNVLGLLGLDCRTRM